MENSAGFDPETKTLIWVAGDNIDQKQDAMIFNVVDAESTDYIVEDRGHTYQLIVSWLETSANYN